MAVSENLSVESCVERIDKYLDANTAKLPYIAVDVNLLNQLKEHMLNYKLLKMQYDIQKAEAVKKPKAPAQNESIPLNRKAPKSVKIVKIVDDAENSRDEYTMDDFRKLFNAFFN
jgi:hypothetical protein